MYTSTSLTTELENHILLISTHINLMGWYIRELEKKYTPDSRYNIELLVN